METIYNNHFTVVAVYKENTERLNQTVSDCLEQMEEGDRLIIVCGNSGDVADELKRKWKKRKCVSVKQAESLQDGYNRIVSETESEYILSLIHI